MKLRTGFVFATTLIFCFTASLAFAQRGRGGGDDSGRGGRGFGGPGGGAPGGGSSRFGGGAPGGRSGGGFDPSGFLTRLDRNGNGTLDKDEMEGPAKFMLDRLARSNPNIDTSKPIPLSKISEAFKQAQESRSAGRTGGTTRSSGGGGGTDAQALEDAMTLEQLVMGFDPPEELSPVSGFGAAGELFTIQVLPEDERTAKDRMRRYDRNRNGYMDKDELNGWVGNPMDFDRNGDGRLSPSELAVRYAHRRVAEAEIKSSKSRTESSNSRRRERKREPEDQYDGRKTYVLQTSGDEDGLPGWFEDCDGNQDGQVIMAEYAKEWNDDLVKEFFNFDLNEDGTITRRECIAAVEDGATRSSGIAAGKAPSSSYASRSSSSGGGSGRSGSSSSRSGGTSSSRSGGTSSSSKTPAKNNANVAPVAADKLDPKYVKTATNIIKSNDKNGDKVLTASEWKNMFLDISPADHNRDGRITMEEYAGWMQARSKR